MNNTFQYRMIKGRIAETLIKELFQQCGYNVFEYGMERVMPAILDKIKAVKSETAQSIRTMPDFVVQSPIGELHYVEVKYRKSGIFRLDKMHEFPYKNAWFIIVSKHDIRCISYTELCKVGELNYQTGQNLSENQTFKLDPEIVNTYARYCQDFYEGVE